jgi:hypothetical protein
MFDSTASPPRHSKKRRLRQRFPEEICFMTVKGRRFRRRVVFDEGAKLRGWTERSRQWRRAAFLVIVVSSGLMAPDRSHRSSLERISSKTCCVMSSAREGSQPLCNAQHKRTVSLEYRLDFAAFLIDAHID